MIKPPLPAIPFAGSDRFIAAVDAAVQAGDRHAVTTQLRSALCGLIRDPGIELPACVLAPIADHYARRELYRSPAHGYSIVAMTWGPGQGTPVHDHCGLWCVEGVWHGELEITQYELLESRADRSRFRAAGGMQAGPGSAGSLIPPHEYHAIANASADQVAVSVHVYEAPIEHCCKFEPEARGPDDSYEGEWYRRVDARLSVDNAA